MRYIALVTVSMLLVSCAGVQAATVTLVDGQTVQGHQVLLADGKFRLLDEQGRDAGQWPLDAVTAVTFDKVAEATDPGENVGWVYFVGGRVRGTVESFDGDTLAVTSAELGGAIKLPVACVEGVCFTKTVPDGFPGTSDPTQDFLVLANRDRVSGTLNSLDDKTVAFHGKDFGDLKLERSRVLAARVVPVGKRPVRPVPSLKFALAGGSVVELGAVTLGEGRITGEIFGGPKVSLPADRVTNIEVVGGRLVYLETLEPKEYLQQSLDLLKWEVKRGLNVLGQPMQIRRPGAQAPETVSHGLGVHGPCRLVYDLGGQFERFLAAVGIDESSGRWADVNVIVKVDGREVFRADHVKWQEPVRMVNVPVMGAASLELVVEVGEHFDVQDRVNWAEARLLRPAAK